MRTIRIYTTQALCPGIKVHLEPRASHHLKNVLRIKPGQAINLFNGQDAEYSGEVSNVSKSGVSVQLIETIDNDSESPLYSSLILAISKGDRMDYAIQKSVELGINEIFPVISEYSAIKLDEERRRKKQQHWQSVAIHAAEQSGRNRITTIHTIAPMPDIASQDLQDSPVLYADPRANHGINQWIVDHPALSRINILIGPEGGLSKNETEQLDSLGAQAIQLGPRILRTETAPLVLLALLQNRYGNLG